MDHHDAEQFRSQLGEMIGRDIVYVTAADEQRHFDPIMFVEQYAGELFLVFVSGAATMLSGQESRAGAPPASYAVGDDGKDLILRIENSTYPTPPSGSETSPWSGQR